MDGWETPMPSSCRFAFAHRAETRPVEGYAAKGIAPEQPPGLSRLETGRYRTVPPGLVVACSGFPLTEFDVGLPTVLKHFSNTLPFCITSRRIIAHVDDAKGITLLGNARSTSSCCGTLSSTYLLFSYRSFRALLISDNR